MSRQQKHGIRWAAKPIGPHCPTYDVSSRFFLRYRELVPRNCYRFDETTRDLSLRQYDEMPLACTRIAV